MVYAKINGNVEGQGAVDGSGNYTMEVIGNADLVGLTIHFFVGNVDSGSTATFKQMPVPPKRTVNLAIIGQQYTLTYTAGAGGSISGTSPQTVIAGGSGTAVTAVANGCYQFVNWSDGVLTASRTDTNVQGNINVTATFAAKTVTLTYAAGANGTLTGNASQTINCGGSGTQVTAVPNGCYHFASWSDGVLTASRTDSNVQANINVTANFAVNTVTLTYTAGANGTLNGSLSQTINCGASGTAVNAVANDGYHFKKWSDESTANPRTDTNVQASVSVTASFEANPVCPISGSIMSIPLKAGWNTFSIPVKPAASIAKWGDFIILNSLSVQAVYGYNAVTQIWVPMYSADSLVALDGYYILMDAAGSACIAPSDSQSQPPTKSLSPGLNLVGVASLVDVDVATLLTTVTSGYDLVVNPAINGAGNWVNNIYIKGSSPIPTAKVGLAYWVNMQATGTLVGFTSTPLP